MARVSASAYRAPRWARSAHVQSVLASGSLRIAHAARMLKATGCQTREHIIDAGEGARLLGLHSHLPARTPRGLALLLHGWEGSAQSGYMQATAARLLDAGFDVFRLNFRDHGPSHHLNVGLFHSCRLPEVLHAAREVHSRWPAQPLVCAGYSLGGNFALRLALTGPAAGLPLARVAAVCPALDPERTTTAMEQGFPLYRHYFRHKWARSLREKRRLFPDTHAFDDALLRTGLRGLTQGLIERYDDFDFADASAYFDGYRISRDRLAGLTVPVDILTAADDPVIPVADFHALQLPESAHVEIATHGGHCGFITNTRLGTYAEGWVCAKLVNALESSTR